MSLCGDITRNNLIDCTDPITGGTRDALTIFNHSDLDSVLYGIDGYTIEAITLKVGAVAYIIDGQNNSITPRFEMVKVGFFKNFDHEIIAKGFDISPAAKVDFNNAKDGKYIGICENYDRGLTGNRAFELYGLRAGLELTALTRQPNDDDTQGAFDFTFFTDKNKEPLMPNPIFITDYPTTAAVVAGLLV